MRNLDDKDDDLKLGDGLLAQIMKEGNVVNYKPINFDDPEEVKDFQSRWKKFCKEEDERRKKHKPSHSAWLLLSYPDDLFKVAYFDDSVIWIGGIDVHDAIEERARKLKLI
jgi:formylmethanofuran dehydrogenase subunit E